MVAATTAEGSETGTGVRKEMASNWRLDPSHTEAGFAVKHLMISTVRGKFGRVEGIIVLDEKEPTKSTATVEIDAASLDTREDKRDTHLRSADFLDVENYPKIRFSTRRIEETGAGEYRVTGDLTIRDRTHEVVLEVTDEGRAKSPWGQEVAAFRATTAIDRRDWKMEWNQTLETGGILVGNEVKITIEAEAIREPA
jgi:polyisoprenoid-binding protein YceI